MTIKLTKEQAEMILEAISAYIREEEREQYQANINGYNPPIYYETISKLRELKQNIDNQIN